MLIKILTDIDTITDAYNHWRYSWRCTHSQHSSAKDATAAGADPVIKSAEGSTELSERIIKSAEGSTKLSEKIIKSAEGSTKLSERIIKSAEGKTYSSSVRAWAMKEGLPGVCAYLKVSP